MYSPYSQRESPLWSRRERMRVESPSHECMAGQLTKAALTHNVGSPMQVRMAHPIIWGGTGKCCHVDVVVTHSLCPAFLSLPPGFLFMAIFACIVVSSPLMISHLEWVGGYIACRRMALNACVATRAQQKEQERTCGMARDPTNPLFSLFLKRG